MKPNSGGMLKMLAVIMAIIGAWGSIEIARHRPLDPDMFHAVIVWDGILHHGLSWLNEWRFTQDNWLFSLIPFQVALIQLPVAPSIVVTSSGWVIFALAAITSGEIARQLGARSAAPLVTGILLMINAYGHWEGNVAYPVSHNITNLLGLVSLLFTLKWINNPRLLTALMVVFVQLIAALSDPWGLPTYTLPMLLALSVLVLRDKIQHRCMQCGIITFIALSLFVVLSVKTRLFGILDILPVMHFSIGDIPTLGNNAYFLVRNLGGLFALVYPVWNAHLYWPETQILFASISVILVLGTYFYAVFRVLRTSDRRDWVFFFCFSVFSVLGICTAYVISSVRADLAARFQINIVYIVVISLAVFVEAYWKKFGRLQKYFLGLLITLYCIGSATSLINFIFNSGWPHRDSTARQLINLLEVHRLDYGYGPYHGAKTAVVTVLTENRIKIRPVSFDQRTGRVSFAHPQTHPVWYEDSDHRQNQRNYFFYLPQDTPECPQYLLCEAALTRDFGEPIQRIPFNGGVIMVWDHPLQGWANRQALKVGLDTPVLFNNEHWLPHWSGWTFPEPWGIWSVADRAYTYFEFDRPTNLPIKVKILSQAYAPYNGMHQRIHVYVNGLFHAEWIFTPEHNREWRSLEVGPDQLVDRKKLSVEFFILDPVSPKQRGVSMDDRKLGIGLSEIVFHHITADRP